MSSAPTQIAVAPSASSLVSATTQIQKDFLEEPLVRQTSLGNRVRGGLKGKHLTRSHAMRESASPPRTPTPRSDHLNASPVSGLSSSSENINDSRVHVQSSSSSTSSSLDTSSVVIVTSQHTQQQQQQSHSSVIMYSTTDNTGNGGVVCSQSQLDVDFPKLTPPKSSKSPRNNTNNNSVQHRDTGEKQHQQQQQQQQQLNMNDHKTVHIISTATNTTTNMDTIATNNNNNNCTGSNGKLISNKNNDCTGNNGNGNGNGISNKTNSNSNGNTNNSHNNSSPTTIVSSHSAASNNIHHQTPPSSHHHYHHQHLSPTDHHDNNSNHSNASSNVTVTSSPPLVSFDKENRCPRISSGQNGGCCGGGGGNGNGCNNNSSCPYSHDDNQNNMSESPTDGTLKGERLSKKHRSGANAKGSKPRLKNMGSSSSVEGGNSTSGFISRDSSTEQFTDQSGIDLVQFFKDTLNKNPKDRNTLMKIEKDLIELAHDKSKNELKFPAMSSYNRMLIHRVAAFFGMEHNVDTQTQQCVIVATTKSTRIPDIRFKSLFRDRMSDEPRKSILKRDSHSFDDTTRHGLLMCPDRGILDRKAKSFEEREEEYEKVRRRIFRGRECGDMVEEHYNNWPWSSSDSSDQSARLRNNKLLKVQSLSIDSRQDGRPSVSKSHSFGGYGGPPQSGGPLSRGDSVNSTKSAGGRLFPKQDSTGSASTSTPWRLSPSSSGYKTQTQSLRSDSVTPSPTGYGSDDHTPEPSVVQSPPAASCGVVWAVTDMASVPRGSVLINPQTLQPIVNQDGSIYHFDPSNLPPSQAVSSGMYNSNKSSVGATTMNRKKFEKQRSIKSDNIIQCGSTNPNINGNNSNNNNSISSTHNNSNNNTPNTCNMSSNNGSIRDSVNSSNNPNPESSMENLSESSAQTVLNAVSCQEIEEQQQNITKDNHNHRDMSDIQEESINQSLEDNDTVATNPDSLLTDVEPQPKLKHQATSPNIPSPEPIHPTQLNEVTTTNNSSSDGNSPQSHTASNSTTSSSASSNHTHESKKDDVKSSNTAMPVVGYTTGYQALDGSTVYSPASSTPYSTTTYQTPDGSVYAVPQPMVYAYPPPMDTEIQGYFMPVYDQSAGQRDGNGSLVPTTAQAIYQPAGGATAVVPVTYQASPYGGAPIYQSQVVYAPDQFATTATATGQMPQYPMTCPVGYPYPYNGYWGQTMTYYVPQPPLPNAVPSIIPSQLTSGTSNQTSVGQHQSHNHNGNNGKRSTPPQQTLSSGHNSQSATPANTYQFAQGVPLALATDANGPTMYAIPQSAVFPNMLPYAPPATPSAAAGVLSHLPHHQHSAVINPIISSHPSGSAGPPIPIDPSSSGGFGLTNSNGTHGNNNGTPHSAPSTPLSNPLPLSHHQQRNPPLFATPPILPNGYNTQMHHHFHQSYTDSQNIANSSFFGNPSSERKNSSNNIGGNPKKGGIGNSGNGGYIQQNGGRQSNYNNANNQRKLNPGDNSINNSNNQNSSNNRPHQNIMQQKRLNNDNKSQMPSGGGGGGGGLVNNTNSNNGAQISDKPRSAGIRPKPANLDLRRNASQRNSPSTNSAESNNNSPNSIASNHLIGNTPADHPQSMYMTRGTHIPPMHPPTAAAVVAAAHAVAAAANDAACHQQYIGAYNHPAPAGMYVKYGQTYFTHPSMALPNNRRSPPNELRPPLTPLTGVYPAVNMMLPAPRQMQPRHPNPNYKGNKPSR